MDYEDELRAVLAPGVKDFLATITEKINNGELQYDEDAGGYYLENEELDLPDLFEIEIDY